MARTPEDEVVAPPTEDTTQRRMPMLLRRAWYGLNQAFRRRIAHIGITPDQFTVLRTLTEGDERGITQRELAQCMSSDPNTIASLLERMEKAGLLERGAHERDRRANRIRLLPPGIKKYEKARGVALKLQTQILETLSPARRAKFLEELSAIADACKDVADGK